MFLSLNYRIILGNLMFLKVYTVVSPLWYVWCNSAVRYTYFLTQKYLQKSSVNVVL